MNTESIVKRLNTGLELLEVVQAIVPRCKCPQHDQLMSVLSSAHFLLSDGIQNLRWNEEKR